MFASKTYAGRCALQSDPLVARPASATAQPFQGLIGLRGGQATTSAFSTLALCLAAAAAQAQDPAQPQQAQPVLEEIQVTGSRIDRTGFTTPVPVTAVEVGELRTFEPGAGLSQQLDHLPQFFFNTTAENSGGAIFGDAGQSHVNMRGMGRERTLVLLDGSRVVPSDRYSSVNVDYLPSALVRRVEVVTGGASAAYGADALAGVTNFILDREYTGFQAAMTGGIAQWGGGENWRAETTFGTPVTERLHVIGSLEARKVNHFRRGWRDNPNEVRWHQDWGYVLNPEWAALSPAERTARQEAGEFLPQRLTRTQVHSTRSTPTGLIIQNGFAFDGYTFNETASGVRPFVAGDFASFFGPGTLGTSMGGPEYTNSRYASQNGPSSNEVKQRTGFLGLNYQLTDDVTLWANGIVGRIESNQYHVGTTTMTSIWALQLFAENAFLPEAVRDAMIAEDRSSIRVDRSGFVNDETFGNSSTNVNVHSMHSLTLGANAQLPAGWNLRGSYQFGEANKRTEGRDWLRMDRMYLALDAVRDPETGAIVCNIQVVQRELAAQGRNLEEELHQWAQENMVVPQHHEGAPLEPGPPDYPISVDSIDNTIRDCVPINVIGQNNTSAAAREYVLQTKVGLSDVDQHFLEVMGSGTLHPGWGAGAIEQALGATYRRESIKQYVPAGSAAKAVDHLGPPRNVPELGVRGIPAGFSQGSSNMHRFSTVADYGGSFNVWEVFSETIVPLYTAPSGNQRVELNLAGRYAQYSRAGGIWVWKGGLDFQVTNDIRFRGTFSRDIREGTFAEQFDARGTGANVNDPAFDDAVHAVTVIQGGNPEIEPEKAETTVLGLVYRPSFIPGLSLSADWYNVDLTEAIGQLGAQTIVEACHFDGVLCDRVRRNEQGHVGSVVDTFINIDAARVKGWDLEASYRMQPNFVSGMSESLVFRALGGYLGDRSSTPLGGSPNQLAGSWTQPKWNTTGSVSYNVGPFGVRLQQNWQSSSKRSLNWVEGVHVDNNRVASRTVTNLGLNYNLETGAGAFRTSLNVNNLFNRDPVLRGSGHVGDTAGRRFSLGLAYRYE